MNWQPIVNPTNSMGLRMRQGEFDEEWHEIGIKGTQVSKGDEFETFKKEVWI